MKRYLTIVGILIQFATAEDLSIILECKINEIAISDPITLNQGDTAKLEFASGPNNYPFNMRYTRNGKQINIDTMRQYGGVGSPWETNPVTVAGPAVIVFSSNWTGSSLATLRITRAGTASPPAAIPQEAGSKFDVILESSSDLINWTPANPGEYSGTEPKRFFRTRIVKKP